MSTATTLEDLSSGQARITDTFGLASWAAVIGVLLAWWVIKSEAPVNLEENMVTTTHVLSSPLTQVNQMGMSLVERGDTAFAAGDIVTPPGDNALYYYREALASAPGDADAQRGLNQVIDFLLNEAESSIYHSDFAQARENADKVLAIDSRNEHALDVRARAERLERVETLLNRAVELYAAGQLTSPANENAADLYQEVLRLEPGNDAAKQGVASVVQRVVANAESAMFAGNTARARQYLAEAKALDPNAPGISTLEQAEQNILEEKEDQAVSGKLQAAAEALQANLLMPPAEPNAYTLYQEVLAVEPNSEAAKRGIQLVRSTLLDRARTLLASDNMTQTRALLDSAEQAGASATAIAEIRERANYRQRLLDAQAGKFDKLYAVSDLTPVRVSAPRYPRTAPRGASGSVDMHLTVTENGDVRDVEVLGNPREYFERAAIQAVRSWRFEPMVENGYPVPVRVAVRVTFEI